MAQTEPARPPEGAPGRDLPAGLTARIVAAWRDSWGVARAERAADPGEPRILAYALGGCLALWLASLPQELRDSALGVGPTAEADPVLLVIASLVSMLFFTPLALYGVAALLRVALRLVGGTGGWRETRLAVFWSLLPAAPALLLGYGAAFLLTVSGAGALAGVPRLLAGLVWLRFWSVGLAEAHGFRSAWPIFAAIAALALAFTLAGPGGPGAAG